MNRHQLAWGTQYELIRFYTKSAEYLFTLDEYKSIFSDLRGPNTKASEVERQLKDLRDKRLKSRESENMRAGGSLEYEGVPSKKLRDIKEDAAKAERAISDPWAELDREEAALDKGDYAGHGLSESNPNWYGGQGLFINNLLLPSINLFALLLSAVHSAIGGNDKRKIVFRSIHISS